MISLQLIQQKEMAFMVNLPRDSVSKFVFMFQECASSGGSACCNATTCKLHASAQCAVGPCCQNCSVS